MLMVLAMFIQAGANTISNSFFTLTFDSTGRVSGISNVASGVSTKACGTESMIHVRGEF